MSKVLESSDVFIIVEDILCVHLVLCMIRIVSRCLCLPSKRSMVGDIVLIAKGWHRWCLILPILVIFTRLIALAECIWRELSEIIRGVRHRLKVRILLGACHIRYPSNVSAIILDVSAVLRT